MEKDAAKEANGIRKNALVSVESPRLGDHVDGEEEFSESATLLPSRKGGISRNKEKVCRKVQWNDNNGYKLEEVLVFEPSDAGDSDEDDTESCFCTIM